MTPGRTRPGAFAGIGAIEHFGGAPLETHREAIPGASIRGGCGTCGGARRDGARRPPPAGPGAAAARVRGGRLIDLPHPEEEARP